MNLPDGKIFCFPVEASADQPRAGGNGDILFANDELPKRELRRVTAMPDTVASTTLE